MSPWLCPGWRGRPWPVHSKAPRGLGGTHWAHRLGSNPARSAFQLREPELESTRVWDGEERMSEGSRISDLGA